MLSVEVGFRQLDLRKTTENKYACLCKFANTIIANIARMTRPSRWRHTYVQGWKTLPEFVEYEAHAMWNPSDLEIVAYCDIAVYNI